tara:strand:- start:920 stop:1207 length:288 start_codon:yes stop_codon:yes gene_type:complete
MRMIKLGNTLFLAELVQGAAINEAPRDFQGTWRFKVTIYLNSEGLKAVSYPTKTKEEAEKVIKAILGESKVIDIEDITALKSPTPEEMAKDLNNV